MSKTYTSIIRSRKAHRICQPRYLSSLTAGYEDIKEEFPEVPVHYVRINTGQRRKAYKQLNQDERYWTIIWGFRKQLSSFLKTTRYRYNRVIQTYSYRLDRFVTPDFTVELHLNTRTLQVKGYYLKVVGEKHKYFHTLREVVEYLYNENLTDNYCEINTDPISYTVTGLDFSINITQKTLNYFIEDLEEVFKVKSWLAFTQVLQADLYAKKPYIEVYYQHEDYGRCPMKKLILEINDPNLQAI